MKAIRVSQFGGPDVLKWEDVETPVPGPREAVVKLEAVGVNFIDVYHRTGLYKSPLPFTPGMEGAGKVTAVGPEVTDLKVGTSVAWAMHQGSYAQFAKVPAWKLVPRPANVDARAGAAVMLQGMTAHYLCRSTYPVQKGDTVLVHAAAGGVGLLLSQLCRNLGAVVIGTVGSEAKAQLAKEAGCTHTILYKTQDFEAEVKRITDGKGCHAVYDSVGKTTWEKSLACLRPRGYLAVFGNSSGPVPPVDPLLLSTRGSVYLTRPTLANYAADRAELLMRSGELFADIAAGRLKLRIEHTWPLKDAAAAHVALEGRETTGKLLLLPE